MRGTHSTYPRYAAQEALYRPLEHILEDCTCRTLARLLGVSKDTAMLIKREPWLFEEERSEEHRGKGWSYDEIDCRVRKALERELNAREDR